MSGRVLESWKNGPVRAAVIEFVTSATQQGPGFVRGRGQDRDVRQRRDVVGGAADAAAVRLRVPQVGRGDQRRTRRWRASSRTRRSSRRTRRSFRVSRPRTQRSSRRSRTGSLVRGRGRRRRSSRRRCASGVRRSSSRNSTSCTSQLVYKPMLELLEFLTANEFRVFVCSGGGRDFMRVFAEETWGIYKENVIGSAAGLQVQPTARSSARRRFSAVSRWARANPSTSSPRPAGCLSFAGGNADVDIEMLETAKFALLVNHDDGEREFAYTAAAEQSLAKAKELGWTVVSMRNDWTTIF